MLDDSVVKNLERQYNLAHEAKDVRTYFTYLFNYLQTIFENEDLHSLILMKYEDTRKDDCFEFDRISNELDFELTKFAKKIIKYIRSMPDRDDNMLKIADRVESYIDGRVESTVGKIKALNGELRLVTEEILENQTIDEKIIRDYVNIDENKNIIAFKLDPLFTQYLKQEHEIERIKVTKWWYMWEELQLLWDVWIRYNELNMHYMSKNMGLTLVSNYMLNEECANVLHKNDDSDNTFFTLDKYLIYLNSFHVRMLDYFSDKIMNSDNTKESTDRSDKRNKTNAKLSNNKPALTSKLKLEPDSYSKEKGVLRITPSIRVMISHSGKSRRPNKKKYQQCLMLDRIFNNVNTMKQGVSLSKILGVSGSIITASHVQKIRNDVYVINKKVSEAGGPNNLIKIQNNKVFINSSYL